jgi:hypothetical protein
MWLPTRTNARSLHRLTPDRESTQLAALCRPMETKNSEALISVDASDRSATGRLRIHLPAADAKVLVLGLAFLPGNLRAVVSWTKCTNV